MSVLQKLFNFIHSKPKASHFKVKDLNVYFKDAIKPSYKLINLENIDSLDLQIEFDDKEYNLVAYLLKNGKEAGILLGTFETKKEAEEAFHLVKNKIYNGGKSLLTIANGIVLFILYTAFVMSFSQSLKHDGQSQVNTMNGIGNLAGMTSGNIPNINLGSGNGGNVNMADMSKLQKQLLQQALQQAGQPSGTGGVNIPNMGNNGAAMSNIVSDAIQQAQNQSPVDGQPAPQATNTPAAVQVVEQPRTPGDDILSKIR